MKANSRSWSKPFVNSSRSTINNNKTEDLEVNGAEPLLEEGEEGVAEAVNGIKTVSRFEMFKDFRTIL